ncbi:MAG: 3'-5' exonuclease [Longimicrobiales bacterium]
MTLPVPNRPILFFDFESTGVDPYTDRIVEFCLQPTHGIVRAGRVNPGVPVPAEATAIHGISDADVAACPKFEHYAADLQALVLGAVLCGYSCRRFDTVLLHEELRRAGLPGLQTDDEGLIVHPEIDLFQLWVRHEDRKLVTAARRFGKRELTEDAAHSADSDTAVLPDTLLGMCSEFGLDAGNVDQLVSLSVPEGAVDRDGKFLRRADGVVVFNFGKSRGLPAVEDLGLLEWVMRQAFMTPETRNVARALHNEGVRTWPTMHHVSHRNS